MNTLKCILTNYASLLFHAHLLIHFNDFQYFVALASFVRILENSEINGNNDKNNAIIKVQCLISSEVFFSQQLIFFCLSLVTTFTTPMVPLSLDEPAQDFQHLQGSCDIYNLDHIPQTEYHYHKVFVYCSCVVKDLPIKLITSAILTDILKRI